MMGAETSATSLASVIARSTCATSLHHARSGVTEFLGGHAKGLGGCPHDELVPSGRSAMRSRVRWRSCRLTRLRRWRAISRLEYDETDEGCCALVGSATTVDLLRALRVGSRRVIRWVSHAVRARHRGLRRTAACSLATAGSQNGAWRGSAMRRRKPCVFRRRQLLGLEGRLVVQQFSSAGVVSHSLISWATGPIRAR